jgi:3-mercaptopyruvate sulfurtransferase SseA
MVLSRKLTAILPNQVEITRLFSCGSGITAVDYLVTKSLVLPIIRQAVYDGSWTEWGQWKAYPLSKKAA